MENRLLTLENNLLANKFKLDESIETILVNEASYETRKDQVLSLQNTLLLLQQFTNAYLQDNTSKNKQNVDFYFKSYIKLAQHLQAAHMTVHSCLMGLDLDHYLELFSSGGLKVNTVKLDVVKDETKATEEKVAEPVEVTKAEVIKAVEVKEQVVVEEPAVGAKPANKTIKAK